MPSQTAHSSNPELGLVVSGQPSGLHEKGWEGARWKRSPNVAPLPTLHQACQIFKNYSGFLDSILPQVNAWGTDMKVHVFCS